MILWPYVQSLILESFPLSCTYNESGKSHSCIYSVIHAPHSEINASHKAVNVVSSSHRQHLLSYTFVLGCSSPSGWHCDHGCHTTHAVFSKTAEDSLAHVTTASRLTCYHGDKSANENSADGCDVDCKLFVLRGWPIFFFFLPPPHCTPPQLLRRRPRYSGTCAREHTHSHRRKKHTQEGYSDTHNTHMHIHTMWNVDVKVVHKRCKGHKKQAALDIK